MGNLLGLRKSPKLKCIPHNCYKLVLNDDLMIKHLQVTTFGVVKLVFRKALNPSLGRQ